MIISRRQAVGIVSAICIICGVFRLCSFNDAVETRKTKLVKQESLSLRNSLKVGDYKNCLANLNGFEQALIQAAGESKIDPMLILAVMTVESDCSLGTISSRGAVGLMQIMPSTAISVGNYNAHSPKDNIRAGAKYLRELKDRFGPDLSLTLAAYNAGPTAVRKYKGVPPYKETQNYVRKVLKVYQGYKL